MVRYELTFDDKIKDTFTGEIYPVHSGYDVAEFFCKMMNQNYDLQNHIDELEDDNDKYHKSLEKLEDYTKRFIPTKCTNEFKDCKTNRYYWLDYEGNFTGALELMNLLDCENEQLKQQIKDLRINVLDSLHEADEIQCSCNPCVVEECVKRVI